LSVVGADRLQHSGYVRAKAAQEALVRAEGVPYTILRSTQSIELMRTVADAATEGNVVRLSPGLVRPIAAQDIARAHTDIADSTPANDMEELAGPDAMRLVDLVERSLRAQHDARRAEATPAARYYGSQLDDETLMPGRHPWLGSTHLDEWLHELVGRRV
jgi:uncharacterized protein YbjT (DUF2867 family)